MRRMFWRDNRGVQSLAIYKLSATRIAKLTVNGMYGDGGNLWLQVTNNGAGKSWIFRWTERGTDKERNMGLGSLDTVNLEKAREYAGRYRLMLHEHKDPKAERNIERLDAKIALDLIKTVNQVADEYFEMRYSSKSAWRRKTTKSHLKIMCALRLATCRSRRSTLP
jgi:hypothetical protein